MGAPTNTWYCDIASVAAGNVNILANLLDPNLSAGRLQEITAVYTMTGNEVANDVIYIARIPSGALVHPQDGSIADNGGIASTATVSVGDTDTQGGTAAYDPARYSGAVDVHATTTTTPVAFSAGTTLTVPPTNPISIASGNTALQSRGVTDDWVWLLATFATLVTPVSGKSLVFRIKVSMLD